MGDVVRGGFAGPVALVVRVAVPVLLAIPGRRPFRRVVTWGDRAAGGAALTGRPATAVPGLRFTDLVVLVAAVLAAGRPWVRNTAVPFVW